MKQKFRQIIRKEINELFESFEFTKNKDEKFVPTIPIATASSLALQVYKQVKSKGWKVNSLDENGNDGSGKLKARELSSRTPQNSNELKRLKAFFEKNQNNVTSERQKYNIPQQQYGTAQEMKKSEAILVWNLHGGDACRDWVNNITQSEHDEDVKTKERLQKAGGAGNNKGMGVFAPPKNPTNIRIHR